MTITLTAGPDLNVTMTVDDARVHTHLYETADEIALACKKLLDEQYVTAWTAEHWESHMVVMPETGPNLPVEVDA